MSESTRSALVAVGIALALVVTPLAAGMAVPGAQGSEASIAASSSSASSVADLPASSATNSSAAEQGSAVRVKRLSVESVSLRNVTATNVTVRELTVRQMGQRENVTLQNVSLRRVTVQQARLSGVALRGAVVRSRELLADFGVPYAAGATIPNASRQRLSVSNRTFDGVVVQQLAVENATGLNVSAPASATANLSVNSSTADFVVERANVSSVESATASSPNATATA